MEPTIIGASRVKLPNVNMPNYGDPLAKIGPPSNGTGSGGGIGSGKGGGVGSGKGGGLGPGVGWRLRRRRIPRGRRRHGAGAALQEGAGVLRGSPQGQVPGHVVLYVEDRSQRPSHQIRVVRSLGLGLDEKAIEAVKQWKFKPGNKDGKPVTVQAHHRSEFPPAVRHVARTVGPGSRLARHALFRPRISPPRLSPEPFASAHGQMRRKCS